MKTTHTPGPWGHRFGQTVENVPAMIESEGGHHVADVFCIDLDGFETREANARLIAASPCLLQEVKDMHETYCPQCEGGCPTLALIAKAEQS